MLPQPAFYRSIVVLVVLAGLSIGTVAAGEDAGVSSTALDALQVLADLTLIDGSCHGDTVNFGVAFAFASRQGILAVTIMPGGQRRTAFETTLKARRISFDHDELCGEIAENYAEALPGSVAFTTPAGARP